MFRSWDAAPRRGCRERHSYGRRRRVVAGLGSVDGNGGAPGRAGRGGSGTDMAEDLGHHNGASEIKRAGIWPYVVVAAGIGVVVVTHSLAVY